MDNTREERNKEIREEIEEDLYREERKKIIKFIFKIIFIIVILFISLFFYIKYISTSKIIVKENKIVNNKIPSSFNGIKIIHFSDLYYGSTIFNKELHNIVKIINRRKPDLVIYNGNLLDKNYDLSNKEKELLIKELSNINSNIGKYALLTENDTDDIKTILNESGFTFIQNNYELIYNNDTNPILLTFLNNDIDKAFDYYNHEENNKDLYNILILEHPDDIKNINKNYDLALSGGSFNGQVCLLKDICFVKNKGSLKYYKEYYKINNKDLYISSGLGSPNINMRFNARPSINFFRLSSK